MKKQSRKLNLKKSAISNLQSNKILGGANATKVHTRCNCAPPRTHRCSNETKCCEYA